MNLRRTLHHLFLPHHTNNQRAKVLHIDALFGYVLLLMIFNLGLRTVHHKLPSVLGYATDIHIEQLMAATNAERTAAGLPVLEFNATLARAAAAKAEYMFKKGYWAHNSPDGTVPWDFINAAGYRYTLAGENLAKNFSNSEGVVAAWMDSPTHKENILKSGYREVGFAVVNGILNGEETTLVVQMFGAPQPFAQAAGPAQTPALEITPAASASTVVAVAGQAVQKNPVIDIPTVTRDVGFVFMGILGGVIAVDAAVVRRRRLVRLTGHNVAHILFLAAIVFVSLGISRGSLL